MFIHYTQTLYRICKVTDEALLHGEEGGKTILRQPTGKQFEK